MLKYIIYILSILTLFSSCSEGVKKTDHELTSEFEDLDSNPIKLDLNGNSNPILKDWLDYYKSLDSTFSVDGFTLDQIDTIAFTQGNVFGSFDKSFNKVYYDFLVYSPNKKMYIDFDSYQWTLGDNNEPQFSVDQEINLVDIENQTVNRIRFYGSSQWVENTFWENDSILYLLENSDENLLTICQINIITQEIKTYKYHDNFTSESDYSEMRLKRNGLTIK